MTYAATNPYELWSTRKSLGVVRNIIPEFNYFSEMFTGQINFDTEWVDFEKLPALNRRLAPFVRPLGTGKPVYQDSATGFRFKPAYIKLNDTVDAGAVLTKIPGIESTIDPARLTPQQRWDALKVQMTETHVRVIKRRWEWMAARALLDGKITISGPEYPTTLLDFRRNANQTVVLTSGNRWGDSGVSIMDFIQAQCDLMIQPTVNSDGSGGFGGIVRKLTMGGRAWTIMRKDPEIKDLMSKIIMNPGADITRGLIASEKVIKVGELPLGGGGGATIELWLNRDSYVDDNGNEVMLMNQNDVLFTADPGAIRGFRCYGAIIDPYAQFQSLDIFARNYMETGDPASEHLLHQSAPLYVPINPNATLKATVCA